MTREEILAMPAGKELDALIAEYIMGFRWFGNPRGIQTLQPIGGGQYIAERRGKNMNVFGLEGNPRLKNYSTDISAAWEVLEKMREQFTNISIHAANGFGVTVWDINRAGDHRSMVGPFNADTAPHAICLTSLMAILEKSHEPANS